MRSREKIQGQRDEVGYHDNNDEQFELILETLLDIRDLLQPVNESATANLELMGKLKAKLEADK